MRSISDNNSQRLSKLLRYGAGLKITADDLSTAIITAIKQSRSECVTSILNAGGDANASDEEGRPALYVLMEHGRGNPEILKSLLRAGANPNKVTWSTQQTALHVAARKGYQVCIKQLLAAGAHVDKQDSSGYTALMYVAREGHITILRALLADKADPNAINANHETALFLAVKGHHVHCVDQLLCQLADTNVVDIKGQTALLIAIRDGNEELIDLLLEHKASVNAQDKVTGKTILHLAIEMQNLQLIIKLLHMNADPNVRDKEWQTPFLMALNMGRRDIMEQLLKAGCKIAATDRSFNTPLHIASINGQADMIHLFIERGIDVNLKGSGGMTPIMLASFGAHIKTVKILLQYGANSSLTDRNHASALAYAILSKAQPAQIYDVVKTLIKANCDVDHAANLSKLIKTFTIELDESIQVDRRLYSPLELAFLRGDSAIFMMLMRAGCDISTFHCDKDMTLQNFKSVHSDLKSRWLLLRGLKKERKRIKSLKELCRRPLLKSFGRNVEMTISSLPISEHLKLFLQFADVDEVCNEYTGDDDIVVMSPKSPTSPRSAIPSPFVRNQRMRSTIHTLGNTRQRSFSHEQSKPCLPKASWDTSVNEPTKVKSPKQRSNSVTASTTTPLQTDGRRLISMSSYTKLSGSSPHSPTDADIVDRPKIGLFKYMKSKIKGNSKDKQSKARSKRARDPRETINMLLHGSSEEYMSSGEITPRPLNMSSIEALHEIDKSPQEDYASVNKMLYGKSLRSPENNKEDFTDRIRNMRKERQSEIETKGVERYINTDQSSESSKVDGVFDFNLKMEALTNGYRESENETRANKTSPIKTDTEMLPPNNNRYPNGEPISPESTPVAQRKNTFNLDNINALLYGSGKQNGYQPNYSPPQKKIISAYNLANNRAENIQTNENIRSPGLKSMPLELLNSPSAKTSPNTESAINHVPRNGYITSEANKFSSNPPSVDVSNGTSSNSASMLSPPTSNADSCDSNGSSNQYKFPTGDAQLMHKYLTSQDTSLDDTKTGNILGKQNAVNLRDLNGNANFSSHNGRDKLAVNMNSEGRARTSSVSSVGSTGSRRSQSTTGSRANQSRIPVLKMGWSPTSAPQSKIPMPTSPLSPSSRGYGNFVRSKSVRKW